MATLLRCPPTPTATPTPTPTPTPYPAAFPTYSLSALRNKTLGRISSRQTLHPTMAQSLSSHQPGPAEIEQHKVTIVNNYGEKLAGVLHETGSKKLVILCHGFRSSKEEGLGRRRLLGVILLTQQSSERRLPCIYTFEDFKLMLMLAAALTRGGISVFRFDFAGNGESEGSFEYGNYRKEADDIRAVILYFSGQNRDISAIAGHSKGGGVVILYASMYSDVPAVVNMSGRFDLKGGIEDRLGKDFLQRIEKDGFIDVKDNTGKVEYRVTKESLMDRLTTDMRAASLSIDKDIRVLTVHGSADEVVPVEDAWEFAKVIPNHKLHIVEGANHCYTSLQHEAELATTLLDFIIPGNQQDKHTPGQVDGVHRAQEEL